MDGYEVTRRIRNESRFAHLPVIALTARNEVEDRHQTRAAGVNDRLVKPVDPRDLKTVLDKYLADSNARGE